LQKEAELGFRVKENDILGNCRKAGFVRARQVLMFLLKNEAGITLSSIGGMIGGRDHSTVIHGIDKIDKLMGSNANFRDDILRLKKVIHN